MDAAPDSTRSPESAPRPAPSPTARTGHWWARRRRWGRFSVPLPALVGVWTLAVLAAVAVLASTAARLTTDPAVSILESDTATPVLEAQSILQGNVLLGGWRMLYDTFWSVDVPFYVIGVLVTGVDPVLLTVVPAVLAVLLLLTACLMAREGHRGGAAAAAVGTVIALIGLPSDVWATLFLHGAWHVGTMLWCLLAFLGLRSNRWGAGWCAAVVLLAAGLLGDLQTVSYGVGAVTLAGVVASLRTRSWLGGAPAVSAAAAAVLGAVLLRTLLAAWGAWTIGAINAPASPEQRWTNLGNIPVWIPRTFGVGTGTWGHSGVPAALTAVRWVAVVAVVVAVLAALWSLIIGVLLGSPSMARRRANRARTSTYGASRRRARPGTGGEPWRIDDMLVLACLADLAFYVYAAQSSLPGYLRYLAPFVVFGSVLAARMAGRLFARVPQGLGRRAIAGAGGVVTALFAAAFIVTAVQPIRPVTGSDLAAFLSEHGLTNGVGSYWTAAMTTVASHGTVTIRPIIISGDGQVVRYGRQSAADWYAGQRFQFLVFDASDNWGGVNQQTVTEALGTPADVFEVGDYRVMTWPRPLTVDPASTAG